MSNLIIPNNHRSQLEQQAQETISSVERGGESNRKDETAEAEVKTYDFSAEAMRRKAFRKQKDLIEKLKLANVALGLNISQEDIHKTTHVVESGSTISSMQYYDNWKRMESKMIEKQESERIKDYYEKEVEDSKKMIEKFRHLLMLLKKKNPQKFEEFAEKLLETKVEYDEQSEKLEIVARSLSNCS